MSLWKLSVVALSGDQADIEVDPASSPSEVLAALGDFAAAERGVQRDLLHEEQRLMWDTTLAESGVADGSTLTLVRTTLDQAQQEANDKALIQAATEGESEEVKRLLFQAGADVEAENRADMTPLRCAAEQGHIAVTRCLIHEAGADVQARDGDHKTPLHFAAQKGHIAVTRCLIHEAGADVEAKTDLYGETPLHHAVNGGHLEIVKLLVLEARANVNHCWSDYATNIHTPTPLFRAEQAHRSDIAEFLRANGGRIRAFGVDTEEEGEAS
eukprot:CAMPEP_0206447934 /NCGR_PEP_ID=MMETSP0324_2-20121206/17135_1 /ASSEMBLY_ACC=CAM_ASM_000836 /TAXON_ID=2866 /ORGANISM="Crypthecodinium cohnii, Strain Seligo" /LENGTH=269 /DNA_ID=CAMNT_0053916907 /DNA_START=57 /DNA_END=866 /DNA_ORIENTATION=-